MSAFLYCPIKSRNNPNRAEQILENIMAADALCLYSLKRRRLMGIGIPHYKPKTVSGL